jgi:hypothetical protein
MSGSSPNREEEEETWKRVVSHLRGRRRRRGEGGVVHEWFLTKEGGGGWVVNEWFLT